MKVYFRVIKLGLILGVLNGIFLIAMPRTESQSLQVELVEAVLPVEIYTEPSRAEMVTKALVQAYPQRVLKAEYRHTADGEYDWAVLIRDRWFYYADGRMLPEEALNRAHLYSPIAFYNNYPVDLQPWTAPSPEEAARLENFAEQRATVMPARAPYFFNTLYRAHDRQESYDRVKTLRFLGTQIIVHYSILEALSLVEERILAASRTDPQVRNWIANIESMTGWFWRNIVGSASRSFHSYGVAIDILARSTGGRAVFWQWAGPNWFNITHEQRFHPPDAVIKAFESYGFVWGGKWLFFDTMHFEYRPEVFILNGIELSTLR